MSHARCKQPSVAELEDRIARIPAELDRAAGVALPRAQNARRIVTTGIGASEGPARLCAHALVEGGIAARFVPLASFAVETIDADLLVAFSQNLSPNARLAFEPRHRFDARWLVTSVGMEKGSSSREPVLEALVARGVVPVVVPPASEDGMLVRVIGPAVAALIALRIAQAFDAPSLRAVDLTLASSVYRAPCAPCGLGQGEVALIGAGVSLEALHGHRWKVLETLLGADPSVWDILQTAHGPLQSFYERTISLLVFATPHATDLVDRLAATLAPERHRVVRILCTRDDALAYFEHLAALDACLVDTLRAAPRDLFHWPAEGVDAPLYSLGDR